MGYGIKRLGGIVICHDAGGIFSFGVDLQGQG